MSFQCKYRGQSAGGNDSQDCNWPWCDCDPKTDEVIAHFQECGLSLIEDGTIDRIKTVLGNMAAETWRPWWNIWTSRWKISDEPLRADAKKLLEALEWRGL